MANPFDQFDAPAASGGNPFDQFDEKPKAKEASAARKLGDLGLSVAKGVVAVPEAAVGLADLVSGGRAGKFLENEGGAVGFRPKQAKEFLTSLQSDDLQSKQQQFQQADGVVDKFGVAVTNPSLIANAVAESVPLMGAGAVPARALLAAAPGVGAVGAGAIGEGLVGAGSAAEQIRQETNDGLLTGKQALLAGGSGLAVGAFGAAGGAAARRLGIADVDTALTQGTLNAGTAAANKGLVRRTAEGVLSEGVLEELPQSLSEQALQNIALDKPVTEGLADAGVMGVLAGGVMGGGAAALTRQQQAQGLPDPDAGQPPVQPAAPASEPPPAPFVNPASLTGNNAAALLGGQGAGLIGAADPLRAVVTPSQAMGIDPNAGVLSRTAAEAVDGPASMEMAVRQAEAAIAAEDNPEAGADPLTAAPDPLIAQVAGYVGEMGTASPQMVAAKFGVTTKRAAELLAQADPTVDDLFPPPQGAANVSNTDAAGTLAAGVGGPVGVDAAGSGPDAGLLAPATGQRTAGTAGTPAPSVQESVAAPVPGRDSDAALKKGPTQTKAKVGGLKELIARNKAAKSNVQDQPQGTAPAAAPAPAEAVQAPQAVGSDGAAQPGAAPAGNTGVEAAGVSAPALAKREDGTLKNKSEYTADEWSAYTKSVIDAKLGAPAASPSPTTTEPTDAPASPEATQAVETTPQGREETALLSDSVKPASKYQLPQGRVADSWTDAKKRGTDHPDYEPNPRQQMLMDEVAKAKDAGAFYANDVKDAVAKALGVDAETLAANTTGVEGGDFGYDVYLAGRAVDAKRKNAREKEIAKELSLKPGDKLGTLVFNDMKVTNSVEVESVSDDGLTFNFKGKRGPVGVKFSTGPVNVKGAIERAHEKGKRKDSYEQFIEARKATAAPAVAAPAADNKPDPAVREKLMAIAKRLGVAVNTANGGFKAGGGAVDIPAEDAQVEGALSPNHVAAHELGHAAMQKRGISFQGHPIGKIKESFIPNWDALVAASKAFRPAVWSSENQRIKDHARKPNEVIADAIGSVYLGLNDLSLLEPMMKGTGTTEFDLGLKDAPSVAAPAPAVAKKLFTDPRTGMPVVVSNKATADAFARSKQLAGKATVRKATPEELSDERNAFAGYNAGEARRIGYVLELAEAPAVAAPAPTQQVQAPAAEPQEITHNGTRIYRTRAKLGDEVKTMWAVETPENKARRAAGERTLGGDTLHDTIEQAKTAADREAKQYAERKAFAEQQDAAERARKGADEARKANNRGKSIAERRKETVLDGQTKLPASAGLGNTTRRNAMQMAVDQGRAVVERQVDDTAAKKRDQEAIDRVRRAGYMLGLSNENIPVVKAGLEAQARLKANDYKKPEYRVYAGSEPSGGFFEITKIEYEYAQELMAQKAATPAAAPAPEPEAQADEFLPEGWTKGINGYTKRPVYRMEQGGGQPFAVVTQTEGMTYEVQIRHGDKQLTTSTQRGALSEVLSGAKAELAKMTQAASVTHQDPGEKPEAATKGVVNDSLKTAAKNEDTKPSEMRKWLLAEIDKELLQAPDRADYDEAVKRMGEKDAISMYTGNGFLGKNAETGFITFDVPGDGKFKVRNSVRGLLEFRKTVNSSLGFKDGGQKTLKPEQNDGVQGGSGGQMAAVTNMIEEGDFEAARDYAEAVGIKLEDVKVPRGDMKPAWEKFLKDGTLPPAAWMPSKEWQFADIGASSFVPDSEKRSATLTRVADGSTYVATVKGNLEGTSASYTVTKDGKEIGRTSSRRPFSETLRMAEDAMPEANDKPAPSKASDTGWNMAGTGYGGKRYRGRNITLADGREVVARIYENAGNYDEVEIKVDGARKFTVRDSFNAQDKADAFIKTLTTTGEKIADKLAAPDKMTPRQFDDWIRQRATIQTEQFRGDRNHGGGDEGVGYIHLSGKVEAGGTNWAGTARGNQDKRDTRLIFRTDDNKIVWYDDASQQVYEVLKDDARLEITRPEPTPKQARDPQEITVTVDGADYTVTFDEPLATISNQAFQDNLDEYGTPGVAKAEFRKLRAQAQAGEKRFDVPNPPTWDYRLKQRGGSTYLIPPVGQAFTPETRRALRDWARDAGFSASIITDNEISVASVTDGPSLDYIVDGVKEQAYGRQADKERAAIKSATGTRRDPTKVSMFNPYNDGDIVTIDGQDWTVKADTPGWYLTTTGNWRGQHPTIRNVKAMADLIREVEQAAAAAPAPQADKPKLTQAEAKDLMEWQDLGQKDGIKTHILTFYESKADKDAKRGRMVVATITKEADSKTWVVEGTDDRLAMLAMAKKKAEDAGMARAVADGFVEPSAAESDYASTADQVEAAKELLLPIRQGEAVSEEDRKTLESLLKIPTLKGFDQPTARRLLMIAGATKAAIEKVMRTNPVSIDDLATELGKATGEAEKKKAFDRAFNAASQIAQTDPKVKELLDIYNVEKSILDGIASERGLYGVKWAERNVSSRWTGQSQKVRSVKQRLVDAVNKAAPSGVRQGLAGARAKKAAEVEAQRATYFTPGNIVKGYGGHDRVLEYTPVDERGTWSVRVQRVMPKDGKWVDAPNERPRWHSTQPEAKELAAGPVVKAKAEPVAVEQSPAKPAAPTNRISDFGEKIGGAKKDMWTGFKDDLAAVADDDIAGQPLSKVWPAPDYQALIDGGASPEVIAFVRSARDEVPAKPRVAYKVKAWANKVRTLRGMAVDLMAGKITMDDVRNQLERTGALSRSMQGFMGRVDLYQAVGHEKSLDGIRMAWHNYTIYKGQKDVSMWVVEKDAAATTFGNWPTELATGKTKEEAIEAFKKAYAKLDSDKEAKKGVQFDIISFRGQDGYWIAKKLGRNHVKVHGPLATVKEAREYRDQNQADLVAKLEKIKEIPNERRDTNEPRVGEDMRGGADVTPELFSETFGFKGVEFGNWVEQGRRQQDLNNAFDALMDMAAVLGIPPRAISLNGQLGLAFGARGSGGSGLIAAAHYEPDKVVINLTKKNGAGSLGHEWWHAVDNYFAKMRKENGGSFMTTARDVLLASRDSGYMPYAGVRPEMVKAFGDVVKAINLTGMKKRASVLDGKRSKEYWTTGEEMSARSFEAYLIAKLQDQNASNDYLANIVSEGAWNAAAALGLENENSYPYPVATEVPGIRAAFDQFFQTVQTKEDDAGNVAMFSRSKASAAGITNQAAEQIVGVITSRWANAPEVAVVESVQDPKVPAAVRRADAAQRSQGATGEPEGFWYGGKAYIVSGALDRPADVVRVLFHEVLGHYGLRGTFGADLKPILAQIATMRKSEVQAKATEYGLDMAIEADRLQAAEEVLAVMAQSNPQAGFVKRAIGAIRAWLRENIPGLENMRLTDNDIVTQFILPARRFVQQGPAARVGDGVLAMSRDEGVRFSRSPRELAGMATDQLKMTLTAPGKLSWWHKTVGTMYNLAERHPAFKPVFNAAQSFIDDVSYYATEAADLAPKMLPKLESWKDIAKSPISAEDNKAIEAPINEGTLLWARDESGRPVKVAELEAQAADMTADQKARRLLRNDKINEGVLKMWQGLPQEQYEKLIDTRYQSQMLTPGVVWTDAELKAIWKLNDAQIGLYREVRAAIDKSLDNLAKSDLVRFVGKDGAGIKDAIMEAGSVDEAALMARDYFIGLAEAEPDRAEMLLATANGIMDRADKVERLKEQGYAPLSRFGKYTVDVVTEEGRQYFGLFESMREANQMAARMRGEFGKDAVSQGTLSDESFKLFQGITPETLELFGNMLGLSDTGDTPQDQAFQAYLKLTKNNRSAMKRLIQRKGILGYSQDVGRVLANFIYSNARQTAGALHIGDLTEAINAIPQSQGELKDEAVRLGEYIKNPQEEAQAFRGLLFAQYLGGSIASAMVNMTQPLQVSFPYLSQFGGAGAAGKELMRAIKGIATGKKDYEPDLARALKHAEDDGTVSPQEVHQLQAQARGAGTLRPGDGTRLGDAQAKVGNAWAKMSLAWGKVFGVAEQLNRRSTFIAAYRLAKAQKMADPAAFAKKAVQETQFIYSKANKMRWGRGAIGGVAMTFKTYSIAYLELLNRMATQGGPEGKRAAMLAIAVLLVMGGAGGLPFMEDAEDITDAIAQVMGYNFSTKQAKQELLQDLFGEAGGAFIERGVSGLPGVPLDVTGRLGMGNLIPGTGLFLQKNSNTRDVLEIAGPAGDLAQRVMNAGGMAVRGNLAGAALELSPKALRDLAKGADMAATDMYRDAKGFKVIDTTAGEAGLKAIGFQPNSVAKVQEANYLMQRQKDFYNATAQNIRAKWARGLFEKDEAMVEDAREEIATWNEKNPDQRMSPNMPAIWKRVREMAKDKDQRIADTAPKAMRQQFREETARVREAL